MSYSSFLPRPWNVRTGAGKEGGCIGAYEAVALSLVLSAIYIPAGQPVSHSVIERERKRARQSTGCYAKSRHPLRRGLSL